MAETLAEMNKRLTQEIFGPLDLGIWSTKQEETPSNEKDED